MVRKAIVGSLVLGFTLTFAGAASARRPAVLVAEQDRVERIYATCPQGLSTPGYRDMLARFRKPSRTPLSVAQPYTVAPQKMRDHVMLSCSAGTVHSGSGYRDMLWRLPIRNEPPLVATPAQPGRVAAR